LVFVAFLVPLGLYLLLLGWINRQPRPVLVSGTWDFVGVLFAASGFLLVGGPAVLTSLNERWRMFWVLGETGSVTEGLDGARQVYLFLASLYFLLVVGVCWGVFARRRATTSIYNVEPALLEDAIAESCEQLGLEPIRSGNVFVFGLVLDPPARRPVGIQAPHALPRAPAAAPVPVEEPAPAEELAGQNAVLEVESFPAMKHVTLRWDPADTAVRAAVEADLDRRLGRLGSPYHETGAWLTLAGSGLLGLSMLITFVLLLRMIYLR
jgi:hypothetical protein